MFRNIIALLLALGVVVSAQPHAPSQLEFASYLGGSAADAATVVRTAPNGDILVGGSTRSDDFLNTGTLAPALPADGAAVGFLTRLRADRTVVYSTFWPRPVMALAVDAAGNAIVADQVPSGSKFTGSTDDVVVSKIDPAGAAILYSVRLGGNRYDHVTAIAVDATGAVVVTGQTASADFPLLNALQTSIRPSDTPWGTSGSAFVAKIDAVGRLVFSTAWGGSGDTEGSGVAIDSGGDIIVSGTTASTDFVTTAAAFQRTLASTKCGEGTLPCRDAFVTRFSADGQTVRYSTLFGGRNGETVSALAVDRFGSPHIAGITASPDLPLQRALQSSCDSSRLVTGCSTYVAKFTPDGSSLQYSTFFGSQSYYVYGPGQVVNALSVDQAGNLVAVGTTQGNDLPLVAPFQTVNGAGPLFKSTDGGATWAPSGRGMSGTGVWHLASGGRQSPLYAAALGGRVYRSTDGAGNWRARRSEAADFASDFAVDPLTPSTLYAFTTYRLLKSTDAGETWTDLGYDDGQIFAVALAPSSPSNVYVASGRGVQHSANGGVTWSASLDVPRQSPASVWPYVQALAIHPHDAGLIFAMISDGRIVRRRGGEPWRDVTALQCPANQMVFSVGTPSMLFARACGKVWRSADEGQSWREVGFAERTAAWMAVDPSQPHAIYVASAQNGVFRSIDRGETWTMIREPLDQDVRAILVDPSAPGTIYIGVTAASNAFVARFDPAGALTLSSYLGGLQATGASVAIDREGSIVVTGAAGLDFPGVQRLQKLYRGAGDAFVARIRLLGF